MTGEAIRRPRRPLLTVVLASIAVNAALGVYALLSSRLGVEEGRVLATSASITGAGMLVFACLPAWERGRPVLLPQLGVVAAILGFALIVVGVWGAASVGWFWKTAGTAIVVAGVCVTASLLSLAHVGHAYRRLFPAAEILAFLLGGLIVVGIWDTLYLRLMGVLIVLLAAATLALPILHLASRRELAPAVAAPTGARFCPSCGHSLAPEQEDRCGACGARFQIHFDKTTSSSLPPVTR